MLYLVLKFAISAAVVVAVSEIARRSSLFGALVASLPLTSLLAFVWLYRDTGSTEQIAALSASIFWLVLPSLLLFVSLSVLLRGGLGFWASLLLSSAATAAAYGLMVMLLRRLGVVL